MKPPKYTLDFNIYLSTDRCNSIKSIDFSRCSPKDLELIANYILYGKDPDGTSVVDRKEIEIKRKFSSFSKKDPVSLDELMESPTFNEDKIKTGKNIYKKPKPSINKDKAALVPGMIELWAAIQELDDILKQNTSGEKITLTSKQLYYLRHQIIEMRRQQYYLMDSEYPIIGQRPHGKSKWYGSPIDEQVEYNVAPRGMMSSENDQDFKNPRQATSEPATTSTSSAKRTFDFCNKDHLYHLIQFYWEIKTSIEKLPDSPLHNLLWTLDFYVEKANLKPKEALIVEDKKLRLPNKLIMKHLEMELGVRHQENYISTIWNKAVEQIAAAADLNYDEWLCRNYDKAWKVCNCCGKELLRDSRNFVRKSRSSDGLTGRCKRCDKAARQKKEKKEVTN